MESSRMKVGGQKKLGQAEDLGLMQGVLIIL
jgi:hypothetical protein